MALADELAAHVELLLMDVDGVLTDGRLYNVPGPDGAMDSSVLIRTALFLSEGGGWRIEARAGGGIVADSQSGLERLETEAKIDALRRALMEARS